MQKKMNTLKNLPKNVWKENDSQVTSVAEVVVVAVAKEVEDLSEGVTKSDDKVMTLVDNRIRLVYGRSNWFTLHSNI